MFIIYERTHLACIHCLISKATFTVTTKKSWKDGSRQKKSKWANDLILMLVFPFSFYITPTLLDSKTEV